MSALSIKGDSSGQVVLAAPNVAGNTSLTLQAITGTAALTSQVIGYEQTWQELKASGARGLSNNYTNTTGKAIMVHVYCSGSGVMTMVVNGLTIGGFQANASSVNGSGTWIVPNGATYSLSGIATLVYWSELR